MLKSMRNIGVENMFHPDDSLRQIYFSWIHNTFLITYLFYIPVECVNSLPHLC